MANWLKLERIMLHGQVLDTHISREREQVFYSLIEEREREQNILQE